MPFTYIHPYIHTPRSKASSDRADLESQLQTYDIIRHNLNPWILTICWLAHLRRHRWYIYLDCSDSYVLLVSIALRVAINRGRVRR